MRNILPLLLFVAAAICVALLWPREVRPVQATPAPADAATRAPARPAVRESSDVERTEQRGNGAGKDGGDRAVLRGRCVDAEGVPLAGVALDVDGRPADRERTDQGGAVQWTAPEARATGADGLFEVAFVPPPKHWFTLGLRLDGRIPMTAQWHELRPGTVKDFGDVVLTAGCMVQGRVLDTGGRPLPAGARIHLGRDFAQVPAGGELTVASDSHDATTAADGTFAVRRPVAPGVWRVSIQKATVRAPDPFIVPRDRAEWFAEVVVAALADAPRIVGVVIDPQGAPVPGADIDVKPRQSGRSQGNAVDAQGRFEVHKTDLDTGVPVKLRFWLDGYESAEFGPVEWGSEGHRVVMIPGASLSLLVTDSATGAPVEDYGLMAAPAPGHSNGWSSSERRIRDRGHHPGGRTVVTGLRRGHYNILVEPSDKTLLPSRMYEFELRDGAGDLHVEVHPGIDRDVVVRTSAGAPIAGTKLQLVQPIRGTSVDTETWIVDLHGRSSSSTARRALLVAAGASDADGRCALRAPPGSGYVLRLMGPGHQPKVVRDVDVRPGLDPLQVTVPVGARVAGSVEPTRLVEQLFDLAEKTRQGPTLRLQRTLPGGAAERFPSTRGAPFELDRQGRFAISGIPPGSWEVLLAWRANAEPVGTLEDLRDGETREMSLKLPHLLLAEVSGKVTHNGEVTAGSILSLMVTAPGRRSRFNNATLDAEGRYRATVVPDDYELMLQLRVGQTVSQIPCPTRLRVSPGIQLTHDVDFLSSACTFRVTGPDGEPRVGVKLRIRAAPGWQNWIESGKDGVVRVLAPRGRLRLHVWPRRLSDPKTRQEFFETHAGDPNAWENAALALPEVEVTAGPRTVTVALPEASGY